MSQDDNEKVMSCRFANCDRRCLVRLKLEDVHDEKHDKEVSANDPSLVYAAHSI